MEIAQEFCAWLNEYNGSAFTATRGIVNALAKAGYEKQNYGGKGYICRNGSSVIAWRWGPQFSHDSPKMVVLASHTDSPCLRTRPHDRVATEMCEQLGVSTYGGGLWHTWFDRPLGLSGCVTYEGTDSQVRVESIRINRPIAVVPNLCIHLQNREEAQAFKPQPEETLRPVLSVSSSTSDSATNEVETLKQLISDECDIKSILSYDLCLYDTTPAQIIGKNYDMINAPGLDNKSSLWTTFKAFLDLDESQICGKLIVCVGFDHEEVGSDSTVGAGGDFLVSTIECLMDHRPLAPYWQNSIVLSCDAAHAVHPNYSSKHQAQHKPYINKGTVIKVNVNQRYATSCESLGVLKQLVQFHPQLKLQEFVVRNDTPCGSTIGPITATKTGCSTVDVGMPIWAMHSCRETCGVEDLEQMIELCKQVCYHYSKPQYAW